MRIIIILLTLFNLSCKKEHNLRDLEIRHHLENLDGKVIYKSTWNGTNIFMKVSNDEIESLKQNLLDFFIHNNPTVESDPYETTNYSFYIKGSNITSHKSHRWQVNILSTKDIYAVDDTESYLDYEFSEQDLIDYKLFYIVYENGQEFDY